MLSWDIFRLFSLYLKPYAFAINKLLLTIYNDDWFHDKLQHIYPNLKLYTSTNYIDLYQRYLQQGIIMNIFSKKRYVTNGIKADIKNNLVLTFNGDLYHEKDNKILLLDKHVIDLDIFSYIKSFEWYINIKHEGFLLVNIKPTTNFIKVIFKSPYFYALTNFGIYYCNHTGKKVCFYPIQNCVDMIWYDKLYVIDTNDKVYVIDQCGDKSFVCPPDKNLVVKFYQGMFDKNDEPLYKVKNGLIYQSIFYGIKLFEFNRGRIFPFYFPSNESIQKCFHYGDHLMILSDHILYVYIVYNSEIIDLKREIQNVINFYPKYAIIK